jgi:hypothetical protein
MYKLFIKQKRLSQNGSLFLDSLENNSETKSQKYYLMCITQATFQTYLRQLIQISCPRRATLLAKVLAGNSTMCSAQSMIHF